MFQSREVTNNNWSRNTDAPHRLAIQRLKHQYKRQWLSGNYQTTWWVKQSESIYNKFRWCSTGADLHLEEKCLQLCFLTFCGSICFVLHLFLILSPTWGVWVFSNWIDSSAMHCADNNLLCLFGIPPSLGFRSRRILFGPYKHDRHNIFNIEFRSSSEWMSKPRNHWIDSSKILLNAGCNFRLVQDILLDETLQRACILHELIEEDPHWHCAVHAYVEHINDAFFKRALHSQSSWLVCFRRRRTRVNTSFRHNFWLRFPQCLPPHGFLGGRWLRHRRFW